MVAANASPKRRSIVGMISNVREDIERVPRLPRGGNPASNGPTAQEPFAKFDYFLDQCAISVLSRLCSVHLPR